MAQIANPHVIDRFIIFFDWSVILISAI
jgi:hypothetical protein